MSRNHDGHAVNPTTKCLPPFREDLVSPRFKPPHIADASDGCRAFHSYDWYFAFMRKYMKKRRSVFLTPCAATKPIWSSPMHKAIYQKLMRRFPGRESFVVSEPVVLIRYSDLYRLQGAFLYDFPPKLLDDGSRKMFIERLRVLLGGQDIIGCLPKHHAKLVSAAIGEDWTNIWRGDLFAMIRRANPKKWGKVSSVK